MNSHISETQSEAPTEPGKADQQITLGMGCFWGPEALFGHLPGVRRTRVGYAGGTTPSPTYRELGDHSETVEVEFDTAHLPLEEVLDVFWGNHHPTNINGYKGRQYQSLLFYRSEEQREIIERVKGQKEREKSERLETDVLPFDAFHPAEERHQKYYLKRHPDALEKLSSLYPTLNELESSTLAARLNGLAKGYTNRGRILRELDEWPITPEHRETLVRLLKSIKW